MLRIVRLVIVATVALLGWLYTLSTFDSSSSSHTRKWIVLLVRYIYIHWCDVQENVCVVSCTSREMKQVCVIVLQSPVLALGLFGIYLLFSLIVGVLQFQTVPKEAENLQKDIARAREGLRKRGVTLLD